MKRKIKWEPRLNKTNTSLVRTMRRRMALWIPKTGSPIEQFILRHYFQAEDEMKAQIHKRIFGENELSELLGLREVSQ